MEITEEQQQRAINAHGEAYKLFWKHHEIIRQSDKREYLTGKEQNELAYKSSVISIDLLISDECMHKNGEVEPFYFWKLVKKYLEGIV